MAYFKAKQNKTPCCHLEGREMPLKFSTVPLAFQKDQAWEIEMGLLNYIE